MSIPITIPITSSLIFNDPRTLCYTTTPLDSNFKYARLDVETTSELFNMFTKNDKKETKKMEAKKCDRCGKLYEMGNPCDDISLKVRFKYGFVADKEGMSEQRIIEKQTTKIAIRYDNYSSTDHIDLCPDCRESFKRWFENG